MVPQHPSLRRVMNGLMVLVLFAGAACAKRQKAEPQFPLSQCKRVDLFDERLGRLVIGAEDLAVDPATETIFISAYDRHSAEQAARTRADAIPQGGLYAVSLRQLLKTKSESITVSSILDNTAPGDGVRPHGIDFSPAENEVAFVNRGYVLEGKKWRRRAQIEVINPFAPQLSVKDDETPFALTHCAANDVLVREEINVSSFDHGSCGAGAIVENVFSVPRSGIMDNLGEVVFGKTVFANGLAMLPDGRIALAATREKAVRLVEVGSNGKWTQSTRIKLPGAPDNLTTDQQGKLIAAVHPSLISLAVQRRWGRGRASSSIVQIDPATASVRQLFLDKKASLFSAATAAVVFNGALVAGSVVDQGLLVCGPADGVSDRAAMKPEQQQ